MRPKLMLPMALCVVIGMVAGCGGKRPPEVAGAPPPPQASPGRASGDLAPVEPVDAGPDIHPMEAGGLAQGELTGWGGGEGGPLRDIHFGYDQATLVPEAQASLEQHALWLQTHRDLSVTVEGHCDERGTVEYNLALGDQRAQVAREYLIGLGVDPGRLRTVSYGKERPLDPGHGEEAWARNRRAHFVVSR